MGDFLRQLRERKLVQWALAYVAASFALIQVLDVVAQRFGWPESLERLLILALAVGFFVALVLAWYHGERGAQRVTGTELLILALLLAIGGALMWRLARQSPEGPAVVATKPVTTSGAPIPQKSIAVLPFTDLSPGHDQEYFSDGMAEEILDALAKITDLKVAGRTSSFSFKGRNEDLRSIGAALGVANVLEGSVRKQGNKVRITAQLIRTDDGFHVWSESYDGELSDVFALQERIAQSITVALKTALGSDQKTRLVQAGTANAEAYSLYLQATDALNRRDYVRMGEGIGWLEKAIALDPAFARAHARLAMIHLLGKAENGSSDAEAEKHAQGALALDPTIAEAQTALGTLASKRRHYLDSRVAMDHALELAPNDASVHLYTGQRLIVTGYTRQGIAHLDRALAIDPLLPNALYWRGRQYLNAGQIDTAERLFTQARDLGLSFADAGLASTARARGDTARSNDLLISVLVRFGNADCLAKPELSLRSMLAADPATENGLRQVHAVIGECLGTHPDLVPIWVHLRLLLIGEPQRALDLIVPGPTRDDAGLFMDFWGPLGTDARRLPMFAGFARKIGFAALWDKYGAPDLCSRNTAGDYVCN